MPGAWRWLAAVAVLLKCSSPAQEDVPSHPPPPAASQAPTDDWQQRVQRRISDSEYRIRRGGDGWEAGNRAQGLRARWGDDGVSVQPRTEDGPTVQLTLTSWGRQSLEPVAPADFEEGGPRTDGAVDVDGTPLLRLMASHGLVTEWWENRAEGLEQGFTIARAPAGDGPLRLVLSVTGARVTGEAADAVTLEAAGGQRLRYAGMKAWDADKRPLRAWLEARGAEVQLVVDDAQASYPLQVDPLLTAAAWTAESNQASAEFGISVASAGDVNGDGFGDVIVGAQQFDNGEADEGRAFVYLGSASGLSPAAAWTAESNQANSYFGSSVASAGDVNGDGFGDVIVGALFFDNGETNETNEGRAFVYLGSASGLSTAAAWTAESNQALAGFGCSVASAGDVNGDGYGDGYGDVIVGAFQFDNVETDEGRAFVYLGSASGLATAAAWTAESNQALAGFGSSVASAGDVNGDGFGDVIVGAPGFDNGETNEGRAFVHLGSASGLSTAAAWTAESNQASALFGVCVASAGDVNGDGYGDVIVGAWFFDNGQLSEGRAFVYLGSPSGLSTASAWTAESDQEGAYFGTSVASAGDVNGDGYGDVIIGAYGFTNGQPDEGRAFVYLSSASGLSTAVAWTAESDQRNAQFGSSAASAGDVNGDGYGDVIVGAPLFDNGQTFEGRASVYFGSASGLSTTAAWTAESDQANAQYGISVASAGDVNGDGYADVIVGAKYYDNGQTNEGRLFAYLGNGQDGTQGVALVPQARQRGVVTPVAPGGLLSVSPTAFDIGLLRARLPFGRARVKLQGEVKPLGVPFNGLGLIRSPGWVDTGTTGALAQLTFSSLAGSTAYHWRARLLADPSQGASTATSRWLVGGLSGQPNSVHVRTPGVDAGVVPDAGADAGLDAGADAGASADAGFDAGVDGGGAVDGGQQRLSLRVGCGCSPDASAPGVWWMVTIGLLALARRRRSLRMALASVHVLKALGGPDAHSK